MQELYAPEISWLKHCNHASIPKLIIKSTIKSHAKLKSIKKTRLVCERQQLAEHICHLWTAKKLQLTRFQAAEHSLTFRRQHQQQPQCQICVCVRGYFFSVLTNCGCNFFLCPQSGFAFGFVSEVICFALLL